MEPGLEGAYDTPDAACQPCSHRSRRGLL